MPPTFQNYAKRYKAKRFEDVLIDQKGYEILKPGFSRLNLPYFASDDEIRFILDAVSSIAQHGWKMLPQYRFNIQTAEWHHYSLSSVGLLSQVFLV